MFETFPQIKTITRLLWIIVLLVKYLLSNIVKILWIYSKMTVNLKNTSESKHGDFLYLEFDLLRENMLKSTAGVNPMLSCISE